MRDLKWEVRNSHSPKCAICRSQIFILTKTFQSKKLLSIVCEACHARFTEEDIELFLDLFIIYGGFFGKEKSSKFTVQDILAKTLKNQREEDDFVFEEIFFKLIHKFLLHGIVPEEYQKKLGELLM